MLKNNLFNIFIIHHKNVFYFSLYTSCTRYFKWININNTFTMKERQSQFMLFFYSFDLKHNVTYINLLETLILFYT
jgi:hypothetical protein